MGKTTIFVNNLHSLLQINAAERNSIFPGRKTTWCRDISKIVSFWLHMHAERDDDVLRRNACLLAMFYKYFFVFLAWHDPNFHRIKFSQLRDMIYKNSPLRVQCAWRPCSVLQWSKRHMKNKMRNSWLVVHSQLIGNWGLAAARTSSLSHSGCWVTIPM